MGCGISKSELEETGHGHQIRSLRRKSINIEEKEDDQSDHSVASRPRKSISSLASDGGFLRRVLGSIEKERGAERDLILDSSDNNVGLKSISCSSSLTKEINNSNSFCFKQVETTEKECATEKETTTEESIVANNNNKEVEKHEEINYGRKEEFIIRPSNYKEEASIMFGPGSPSFRVYCAHDEFMDTSFQEDIGDEEREEIKSTKEIEKGSATRAVVKRGRRARQFRNAMHMAGGSALGLKSVFVQRGGSVLGRKNNIVNGLCRSHNQTASIDDTNTLIPKPAV